MIISFEENISIEKTRKICDSISGKGLKLHFINDNGNYKAFIPGSISGFEKFFEGLSGVQSLTNIKSSYQLVSREAKSSDTVIKIDEYSIGNGKLTIIAGPCAVESKDQLFDIVGKLKESGITFIRGGVYKPRTSPYSFQGLMEKGLDYFLEAKQLFGIKVVTEVISADKIPYVREVADIIQIGSRNMQNYPLLNELAKTNKPLLFKRGMAATIEEYLNSAEYLLAGGNSNVILCERGIKTFETSTRNTLDLNAIPVLKEKTHLPVFVDPSHGIGIRSKVTPMALAGIACGADGLLVEVHNDPDKALSDGAQSLTLEMFKDLLKRSENLNAFLLSQNQN